MKKVRMLLRVSSDKQLDSDGDLSVQRKILNDYIALHKDWIIDDVEYFEGSMSAYKNTSMQRQILQEILRDARNHEFDILVPYKDDRVGRLMWDTAQYVMELKRNNVDIYTVKDGCISPEINDIMGQMILALRYANAQKSSLDTGMRVKDTAISLVQKGKFMGGRAPYGYYLEYSGEISKHGRALKHLVKDTSKIVIIQEIFSLVSVHDMGSGQIAKFLNSIETKRVLAPNHVCWKTSTITSILTNPIYAGYLAYKRREHNNSAFIRNTPSEWILSPCIEELKMIEYSEWINVQMIRKKRNHINNKPTKVTLHNMCLNLFQHLFYCSFCKQEMKCIKKYNYWTLKNGTKKKNIQIHYICDCSKNNSTNLLGIDINYTNLEKRLIQEVSKEIDTIMKDISLESLYSSILIEQTNDRLKELKQLENDMEKISENIRIIENRIINELGKDSSISLDELKKLLIRQNERYEENKKKQATIQTNNQSILEQYKKQYQEDEISKIIDHLSWSILFNQANPITKEKIIHLLVKQILIDDNIIQIEFYSL